MERLIGLVRNVRTGLPGRAAWVPVAGYAVLLALGAILLAWLDLQRLARSLPGEVHLALVALVFLVLGVWAGARLFGAAPMPAPGNPAAADALGLTAREREILTLLAEGRTNKDMANRLGVSPNTIKTHLAHLFEKLGARRRTEALARARALNLLT